LQHLALSAAGRDRALPSRITCDNESEFTARAVDHWAYWNRVTLIFSWPGKPTDNGLIEAFNGTLRRECLSPTLFTSIEDAQAVLNTWRADYSSPTQQFAAPAASPLPGGEHLNRGPEWTPRLSRLAAQILGRDHR
jgi:putative transposase